MLTSMKSSFLAISLCGSLLGMAPAFADDERASERVGDLLENYSATGNAKFLDAIKTLAAGSQDPAIQKEAAGALRGAEQINQERAAPPPVVPFNVRVVSVECNGECGDNTLGQLCALSGINRVPIAVDCKDVDDDNPGVTCAAGVASDNRCLQRAVSSSDPLSSYCDDTSGWDAQVYCAQ